VGARRELTAVTVVLGLACVYVNLVMGRVDAAVPRAPLATLPMSLEGWHGVDVGLPPPALQKLGVSEYVMRRFEKGKEAVWVYVGYYAKQQEGMLPHSPRHCYPGNGFAPIAHRVVPIPVRAPGHADIRPNLYVFAKGSDREVVIYWYQSRGRVVASEYLDRLYLIRDAILRGRADGALIRVSTGATAETEPEAVRRLVQFVSIFYPHIPRVVPD